MKNARVCITRMALKNNFRPKKVVLNVDCWQHNWLDWFIHDLEKEVKYEETTQTITFYELLVPKILMAMM